MAFIVFTFVVVALQASLKPEFRQSSQLRLETYGHNSLYLLAILIMWFTTAPFAEEIFFRGFLYNALKTRLNGFYAGILQALVFSAFHRYDLFGSLWAFFIGIVLVIAYEKRRTLLTPIFLHIVLNMLVIVPLLYLTIQNLHTPAKNWEEAKIRPEWFQASPPEKIERQKNGIDQWRYAIDKWGSKGARKWKVEANAFYAVCLWFPDDREACAKAKIGIVTIYNFYLQDYRRAILEADELLAQYPDQKEQCASALSHKGRAYYFLGDFRKSRESFDRVLADFKYYTEPFKIAQEGIEKLDYLEGNKKR